MSGITKYVCLIMAVFVSACSKPDTQTTPFPKIELNGFYQFYRDNVNGLPEPPGSAGPYSISHYVNFCGDSGTEYLCVEFFYQEDVLLYKVKNSVVKFVQEGDRAVSNIAGSDESCAVILDEDTILLKREDGAVFIIAPIIDSALINHLLVAPEKDMSAIYRDIDAVLGI